MDRGPYGHLARLSLDAIRPCGGQLYAVRELCTGCGECVRVCPVDAVTISDHDQRRGG
ncbi:MAG: 4Fe-4S dicluster domain-containing protein [Micromonosporaceae bacterium]|nr:4Fe-4S dicluster domain-containing protein [Micromonosporaceae bacterium]